MGDDFFSPAVEDAGASERKQAHRSPQSQPGAEGEFRKTRRGGWERGRAADTQPRSKQSPAAAAGTQPPEGAGQLRAPTAGILMWQDWRSPPPATIPVNASAENAPGDKDHAATAKVEEASQQTGGEPRNRRIEQLRRETSEANAGYRDIARIRQKISLAKQQEIEAKLKAANAKDDAATHELRAAEAANLANKEEERAERSQKTANARCVGQCFSEPPTLAYRNTMNKLTDFVEGIGRFENGMPKTTVTDIGNFRIFAQYTTPKALEKFDSAWDMSSHIRANEFVVLDKRNNGLAHLYGGASSEQELDVIGDYSLKNDNIQYSVDFHASWWPSWSSQNINFHHSDDAKHKKYFEWDKINSSYEELKGDYDKAGSYERDLLKGVVANKTQNFIINTTENGVYSYTCVVKDPDRQYGIAHRGSGYFGLTPNVYPPTGHPAIIRAPDGSIAVVPGNKALGFDATGNFHLIDPGSRMREGRLAFLRPKQL